MAFNDTTKQQIALKKVVGKAHTRNETDFTNEPKFSGITVSADAVFGESIVNNPQNSALYDSNGIYELVRLKAIPANESTNDQTGRLHAYYLQLPADYSTSSTNPNAGTGNFTSNKPLFETLGAVQLIPPSFGNLYEAKPFKGTDQDTGFGSGDRIFVTDARNWYIDYYNGVFFQETPPANASDDPKWVEAYIYIGQMANVSHASSLSSMWEPHSGDPNSLTPTNIIDGDTGCFAMNFNMYLDNDFVMNTSSYTLTSRNDAKDLYYEIDDNGNITTKE
jgi:hypothetical protein